MKNYLLLTLENTFSEVEIIKPPNFKYSTFLEFFNFFFGQEYNLDLTHIEHAKYEKQVTRVTILSWAHGQGRTTPFPHPNATAACGSVTGNAQLTIIKF